MPALIDSSPGCVVSNEAAEPADDSADFILQANYEDCTGFMTFGPGSTYGDEGTAAETAYYILTCARHRRHPGRGADRMGGLREPAAGRPRGEAQGPRAAADPPAPQPGTQREEI